jgi:hypothetical protein
MDIYRIRIHVQVTLVKQDNAAKDTSLSPVPNTIGYAPGVLVVVAIPWAAKKSGGIGGRIEPLGVLRGAPHTEGVIFMPAVILRIEPSSDLVNGSSNKLDKLGGEAGGSWRSRLVVTKELGAKPSVGSCPDSALTVPISRLDLSCI